MQSHGFFRSLDWGKLERLEIRPPFVPHLRHADSAENFDPEFTSEAPVLTPTDRRMSDTINQSDFSGFSYTAGSFTPSKTVAPIEESRFVI